MDRIAEDKLRSWALAAACAGFVGIPNVGALVGRGEQTRRYDTVITPPDYAFVVWAPIFAGCVASTIAQCRPGERDQPVSRRTGWPLAGAYAINAAWSLAAQSGRFALTPALLPVATACAATAHVRLQRTGTPAPAAAVTSFSTALLLGWTALASVVNLAAGAVLAGAEKTSPRIVVGSTAGLLVASGVVAGAVARSGSGRLPLAAAAGWGLVTTAASSRRPLGVRVAAALGAGAVIVAAVRPGRG